MTDCSASAIADRVRSGAASAREATLDALARVRRSDGDINAFTVITSARALSLADQLDKRRALGEELPALAGVPFAVKNLFDLQGVTTLAGSRIEANRPPATADAFVVRRWIAAGAIPIGALNMDEYAYGFTTENSPFGPTRNPHDLARIAGGSSGGSAAAVAAGMVPLSWGTDTNGSIRVPASLCGVFGLKPTYGRLSRSGIYLFAASLDHVGPFARTVADLALAYDVAQGPDPTDSACAQREPQGMSEILTQGTERLRIAIAGDFFSVNAGTDARAAVALAARALQATQFVDLPESARARAAAFVITAAESGNLHLPNLRNHIDEFQSATRSRLVAGAMMPAAWALQAQRFRHWYVTAMRAVFAGVDAILAPATPCSAVPFGEDNFDLNGSTVATRSAIGLLTQPLSLIGAPIIVAPILREGRLPIGVQIIAAPWREDICFRVAARLEALGIAGAPVAPAYSP